jgi:hypothetical protein
MRNGPIAQLSGIQVAGRERDTVVGMTGEGPPFTRHTIPDPPPPHIKGRMARAVRNPPERH